MNVILKAEVKEMIIIVGVMAVKNYEMMSIRR
jgi:hypothetical protein